MSCASRTRPQSPALDPLTCYRLDDGTLCVVACPPEVAAVLDAPEPELRETTFTDLAARDQPREVDVRTEEWLSNELRAYYRDLRTGRVTDAVWEGPVLSFTRYIGDSRIWEGPPAGRCEWHGARLGWGEYCLRCDRSGADRIIPRPPRRVVTLCRHAEEERRQGKDQGKGKGGRKAGKRLKGGRG